MTVPAVLAIAGVVVLLIGILGGGVKAREIEIPTVPPGGRVLATAMGLALIGTAIWLSSPQGPLAVSPTAVPPTSGSTATTATTNTPTPASTETPTLGLPDPNLIYIIRSALSQKVLDFDSMAVIQSEWTGETHQEWIFEALRGIDEGFYFIHSAQNGNCLDVAGATINDGGEVILYGCTGNDNQKWRITQADSGAVYLEAKHSRKVLDLPNGNRDKGVHLIQYSYQGSKNQEWILTSISALASSPVQLNQTARLVLNHYYSIESYSSPNNYIRHRDYVGTISFIASDIDKQDATFYIVPGLADAKCISFQASNYPNKYLRHKWSLLQLDDAEDSDLFRKDATFCVRSGLANSEDVSFESYNYPGNFIHFRDGFLYQDENDGTLAFRENSTFKLANPLWIP